MKKGDWYRYLFGRITSSINNDYYFEAAFIEYGIIEDRLTSLKEKIGIRNNINGVKNKILAITKIQSIHLENAFNCSNWDGSKYIDLGFFQEILDWGELYRNPLQHTLGDPRKYEAKYGSFHNDNTKDLAIEGEIVARKLSAALMRFKKKS